ncbi:MAG TPA: phytoene/squalene synthase family protein [Polyangia bacterium]|nr:phytoene/squalene synthase family protein [Polyangia bacterium]
MILQAVPDRSLDEILSQVSRSFYLSLAILPRGVRSQLSVAYLVARAADTVADTRVIRAERRVELLGGLRATLDRPQEIVPYVAEVRRAVAGLGEPAREGFVAQEGSPAERVLLERLGDCLRSLAGFEAGDRARTRQVLDTLITGMERDLRRFPEGGSLTALDTMADLDEHCYFAAGCVGEYWTLMTATHVPLVKRLQRPDFVARGVRLGKALQLVNVIRDAAVDLAQGRCYLPRELLARHGLRPEELIDPSARRRARPALDELHALALGHVDASFPYVMAIPRREPRLRLAALWPLWIGLGTLERLRAVDDPLDPARAVKVPRADVYRIIAESTMAVGSDTALANRHAARRRRAAR